MQSAAAGRQEAAARGKRRRLLDLDGAELVLSISSPPIILESPRQERVVGFKPDVFALTIRNGQTIDVPVESLAGGRFVRRVDWSFSTTIALKQ